ncbi:hypothetical protein L1987_74130 [Smallanthus sonchifolius]|uniref:Uncharacterized protein n=1 Tax=Smallanthus sonchifolius TaxID=185202 RepID=A0ACB9A149_9ASTR|nr:hypothetical protein L1987_74130 [Smallanthus sonchifolius]
MQELCVRMRRLPLHFREKFRDFFPNHLSGRDLSLSHTHNLLLIPIRIKIYLRYGYLRAKEHPYYWSRWLHCLSCC